MEKDKQNPQVNKAQKASTRQNDVPHEKKNIEPLSTDNLSKHSKDEANAEQQRKEALTERD